MRSAFFGRWATSVLLAAVFLAICAAPSWAGSANGGLPGAWRSNPLAGMTWGHYTGTMDGVYPAWQRAHGARKQLLAKIALRPLAYWFGSWFDDSYARTAAQEYIASDTGGNPDELAQITVFRLDHWEQAACSDHPGRSVQASYRRWVNNFAAGIGSSRVALVLQPDLPFAFCAPTRVPLSLVAYAARVFSALPHTTVYIDGGVH